MAEALKVKNEESQGSGRAPERETPEWLKRIGEYPRRFRQFLHEVRVEMRQVTWPTRDDVRATTLVVIVTVFFFGFFLFVVDLGVSQVVEKVLKAFRR
ncbi:MAG: preprotein translocase subunit SecE [Acidobacteria bacterium]|nr:preprotein translocase subunit SecE [Acidobacteriota bacterium]MBI3662787.1 preprotein translocase subunit SecE [Acidobacteriota bacterium]